MKFFAIILITTLFFSCRQKQEANQDNTLAPLDKLIAGNEKFASGHPAHPHETTNRIKELKEGQHPFVVLVSCSDSRIPPELIFDQGLGDVFQYEQQAM
jgi:carbonic anhydrase